MFYLYGLAFWKRVENKTFIVKTTSTKLSPRPVHADVGNTNPIEPETLKVSSWSKSLPSDNEYNALKLKSSDFYICKLQN